MKNIILNLTQHKATESQVLEGINDSLDMKYIQELLTFQSLPTREEIEGKAKKLAEYAVSQQATAALIGGAPYLMSALEMALNEKGIEAFYSFSERRSKERHLPDGTVEKINVFEHVGLIPA